jgi:long-chain fatty acid transport protein
MAVACLVVAMGMAAPAGATNGMNLEGYGPVAAAMGGASFAYENGTAATMNNPATLAWSEAGWRLDLALGMLGPDVDAIVSMPGAPAMEAESDANAFFMPALGVFAKRERLGFGLGIFAQGGMGTEYAPDTWMGDPSMGANTALTERLMNRSEVSVGRAIVPVTYDLTPDLRIGASLDFVWAGMDLQMAMSEPQFRDLANPMAQTIGTAEGTLVGAFGQLYEPFGGAGIDTLRHAYFDFSNDSDFTGAAMGTGFAGKLGLVYQVSPKLSLGAVYHSETALGDLETDDAELSMAVHIDPGVFQGTPTGTYMDMNLPVAGKITINDFQWPATYGLGAALRPTERWLLAADVKVIGWSQVMEDFKMTFEADDSAENGAFAGLAMDATLFQEWDDQVVIAGGASYMATPALTLRAGFNHSANPVPAKYLNALFPAIVESHLTWGAGYDFNDATQLNFSVMHAFETTDTNPGNGTTMPAVESAHSQLNAMIMVSHWF